MKSELKYLILLCISSLVVTAQSITIDPSVSNSISTSRSNNNIDIRQTTTGASSGLRFFQNLAIKGGLFYNNNNEVFNLSNSSSTAGFVWDRTNQRVGIGTFTPAGKFTVQFNSTGSVPHILINESNNVDGGRINFENFGIDNKRWTLFGKNADGAVPSENVFNIYHSEYGNIAQFTGDGNTQLNGFTQLGSDAPKIKTKLYTGQLSPSFDDQYIYLDEAFAKIIDYSVLISANHTVTHLAVTTTYTYKFKPSSQNPNGYNYKAFLRYPFGGVSPVGIIAIENLGNNVIGRQYSIYITYME